MAGPLFNLGSLFRQIDETSVDVEELFHMLNTKPRVKEKEDAKDFEWKGGKIEINNLGFKHYDYDQSKTKADSSKKKEE
jgi:ABC-type transport system involved in Fe-S cluster assembly fused permease/ATPase subunit